MPRPRTRTAYLDLRAEERAFQEGYRFLDEMRLALAAEGMRELTAYDATRERFAVAWGRAVAALRVAVTRHGLEALLLQPPAAAAGEVAVTSRARLGVVLQEARGSAPAGLAAPGSTPELVGCAAAWATLVPLLAPLAATTGNLARLKAVYARTARRARALEEILLPEVAAELRVLGDALEEGEREDAVRVREAVQRQGRGR